MEHQQELQKLEGLQICQQHVNIEFRNLTYSVPESKGGSGQKCILRGISGSFQAGRLTAILGPSGAGKSSLLNVLSGFKKTGVSGYIMTNGKVRNIQEFRKQSCYIPQEFAMLSQLTTRETLKIAADLKLNVDVGTRKKNVMIEEILQLLDLQKTENTLIGNLSGGEKKRISVGVELLTNPPVMFFDEPTSGLDSSSSFLVISHLKTLAQSGRTIVCTIHQPSSQLLDMFDDFYIIAEGQCLYRGPLCDMKAVFEEAGFPCPKYYNLSDFAIEIACFERGDTIENLIIKYKGRSGNSEDNPVGCQDDIVIEESTMPQSTKTRIGQTTIEIFSKRRYEKTARYPLSLWMQMFILMRRSVLCNYRDLFMFIIRIAAHGCVGLMLGFICFDIGNEASKTMSNAACLFYILFVLFLISPFITVLVYQLEAAVFLREHLNNWYSLKAYYLSKLFSDIPFQVLCPTLLLVFSYCLSGQPFDMDRMLKTWIMCIVITMCGQTIGLLLGAAFDVKVGPFMVVTLNIPMSLFSGFFMRLQDIPSYLQWVSYVSYYRYSFEAEMVNIYGNNRSKLNCSEDFCYFRSPSKILEEFHMEDVSYWHNMGVLLIWLFGSQIGLYIVLKWRVSTSR
ncbi:ATP-binding cassette sub-family G member 1-like isoform X1 [Periplaneta americana]|uniref:ATP-binding cassette sub-family G member 1-like isoform X1 n=1 Tax=Periplaneta americana TaxID=6978 RepID=UPI0037E7DA3A